MLSKPDESGVLSALEKISLLWDEERNVHDHSDDQDTAEMPAEVKEPIDEVLLMPEFPEARRYLIENDEYRWLISRIQATARTMSIGSIETNTRRAILNSLGKAHQISIELHWSLPAFLEAQYDRPEEVKLHDVLCCSGFGDEVYATTCVKYVELLWPTFGREVIDCLSLALTKNAPNLSSKLSVRI